MEETSRIETYIFPSQKKIDKFPTIHVAGNETRFLDWLYDHPEIDKRVPPIYKEFVIRSETTTTLVCYTDDCTGFFAKCWYKGTYVVSVYVDYSTYTEEKQFRLDVKSNQRAVDSFDPDWIMQTAQFAGVNTIAIQAYMLYHKPEIVEQVYSPGASHSTTAKKHKVAVQPIKIRQTKIKRITLTEQDKPPKEIHYNKLSWPVRGHYRHVGKDKHLVYIQPTVRNRNGKKYSIKAQTYEIEDDK